MTQPHPQRCETCKHKLPDCDKEALGSRVCKKIFLEDPKALQIGIPYFIDIVGCASHSSHPHTPAAPATFPNSAELIQMAEIEWHNREERRGLHDKIPWTTGWMAGFLTPNKPGLCEMNLEVDTRATILSKVEFDEWLKEHDAAIREQVLTEVIQDIEKMIDAEQERTIEGMYSKEGITKLGILAYVSEHFKSLRGGD